MFWFESYDIKEKARSHFTQAWCKENDELDRIIHLVNFSVLYKKLWEMKTKISFETWITPIQSLTINKSSKKYIDIIQYISHANIIGFIEDEYLYLGVEKNIEKLCVISREEMESMEKTLYDNYPRFLGTMRFTVDDKKKTLVMAFDNEENREKISKELLCWKSEKDIPKKYKRYIYNENETTKDTYDYDKMSDIIIELVNKKEN